ERLRKTSFFKEIKVSYSNKSQTELVILSPLTIKEKPNSTEVMPAGAIYASPIADPKWPKFSVGYQKHQKDHHGKSIYSLSFGENLALLRYKDNSMMYELGIQAGLFGIM